MQIAQTYSMTVCGACEVPKFGKAPIPPKCYHCLLVHHKKGLCGLHVPNRSGQWAPSFFLPTAGEGGGCKMGKQAPTFGRQAHHLSNAHPKGHPRGSLQSTNHKNQRAPLTAGANRFADHFGGFRKMAPNCRNTLSSVPVWHWHGRKCACHIDAKLSCRVVTASQTAVGQNGTGSVTLRYSTPWN